MTDKNNNSSNGENSQISQASILTSEETKQILTPFAFEIDKTLFGLPLAVPWRRGIALFLDFLIVAMLAHMSGELLAFLVAVTFVQIGSKKRAKQLGKKRSLRRRMLKWLGSFIIFLILVDNVPRLFETSFWQSNGGTVSEVNQQEVNNKEVLPIANVDTVSPQSQNQQVAEGQEIIYKGVAWAKGVIEDLGLSFGWAAFYFSVLTSIWHGQTLGKKILGIRVIQLDGTPLSVWDSFGRYGGYGAGLATGLMGFLQIYWDPNRQAIHDKIAATIVIDVKLANALQHAGRFAGVRGDKNEE